MIKNGIIILTAIIFISCSNKNDNFKIGAILPLTGPAASFGVGSKNAMILANKAILYDYNLIFEDGQADPKISINALKKLTEVDNVKTIVTMTSRVSMAFKPIIKNRDVLLFANASHPKILDNTHNILRFSNTAQDEANAIIRFLKRRNIKRIGIIAINDDYGRAYVDELSKKFNSIDPNTNLSIEFFSNEINDFRTMFVKLNEINPEFLVIIGFGTKVGVCIRQLNEFGYQKPFIVSLGFILSNDAIATASNVNNEGYYLNFDFTFDERTLKFYNNYVSTFNEEPAPNAYIDYLTIYLIDYLRTNNLLNYDDISEIKKRKYEIENTTILIDEKGNIKMPVSILKYPKGKKPTLWQIK